MTSYEPYPTVTFGGAITYADNTISSIQITNGRNDVTEQPQPGFASIQLWTDASDPLDVTLAQSVSVSIDKGTAGTQEIFKGIVSDIDISIDAYGSDGSIARYSITAVGPLAKLNRQVVGEAGYPDVEKDGTRMFKILNDAFATQWNEVSATLDWQNVPPLTTWANYNDANIATINVDVPGQYDLAAYADGVTDAYSLTSIVANSGRGVLWESGNGEINYDDYAARVSATPLTLTADDLLAQGLRSAAQLGEIVNDATLIYNGGQAQARDEQSVILFGELNGSRDTVLQNLVDAENQAKDFVSQRAYPRTYPEVLTVPLHSPTVSDATRDTLAAVYNGLRINTSALPAVFGTNFDGFVEGYQWNLTRYTAELALICSAYSETYSSIVWYQIPPTTTWAGYTPSTTEWQDL